MAKHIDIGIERVVTSKLRERGLSDKSAAALAKLKAAAARQAFDDAFVAAPGLRGESAYDDAFQAVKAWAAAVAI
jgi:hypothetical protein